MRISVVLAALAATFACQGRPLYNAAPLRDDGKPCRQYADGIEYCGERVDGLPHGRGTMTMPDGKKLTGNWNGRHVRDGVLEVDDRHVVYADFEGLEPVGSYQIDNPVTSEVTQIIADGDARTEVVFTANGEKRRFSDWQAGSDERETTVFEPDGSQTIFREKGGQPQGNVVTVAGDGTVKQLRVFEHGQELTPSALDERILSDARAIAKSDATAEGEKADADREAATRTRDTEKEYLHQKTLEEAQRIADDSVKGPCQCIAEKRKKGEDVLGCYQDPPYEPPRDSDCYCPVTRRCIILKNEDDVCDEACEQARKERDRVEQAHCFAERDAFWAAQRSKFMLRTDVCKRFGADPDAVNREWDRLVHEHNNEVAHELEQVQASSKAAIDAAQQKVDEAIERGNAARARAQVAEQARAEDLKRERELARQRMMDEARREAEDARVRRRAHCEAHPRACCTAVVRPVKPGSHPVCPA